MENVINYLKNAKKGKEGFVFEFEIYDELNKGEFVKYKSGGRRELI